MPRPRCCRRIAGAPCARMFRPLAAPPPGLIDARPEAALPPDAVRLHLEEYEALRLADHEGLYQEEAAARMGVSRQTFGRTIAEARGKVARALVLGLSLIIEDTPPPGLREFRCKACGHSWTAPHGTGQPSGCPACGGANFKRVGCAGMGSGPAQRPRND